MIHMQRLVLVSLLKKHGHEVVAVSDGDAAWEAIGNSTFNIVFTDWMMPGMTGLELIRKIRMTPGGHYVYAIVCTSRSSRADLVEGLTSGADDYIEKPIHEDELLVRLAAGERVIDLERRLEEENRKLEETNRSLKKAYQTIRDDLDAAARMQRSLLLRLRHNSRHSLQFAIYPGQCSGWRRIQFLLHRLGFGRVLSFGCLRARHPCSHALRDPKQNSDHEAGGEQPASCTRTDRLRLCHSSPA